LGHDDRVRGLGPLGVGLAIYAGIFLSIGTGELLPEAHSETSAVRITLTVAGFLLLFVITRLTSL
jgi:zinc transporter ZupT